jgi:hypothetical protein
MKTKMVDLASGVCLALIVVGCGSVVQESTSSALDEADNSQIASATVATEVEVEADAEVNMNVAPTEDTIADETVEVEPAIETTVEKKLTTSPPVLPKLENELAEGEYRWRQLLARDTILPIYEPEFAVAAEAPYDPDELVIGVEINGEAKAYAIGPLNSREMVNDTLGGVPILVTW